MGYRFQFITLAGFHSLNHAMFQLAKGYAKDGMSAYVELQEAEFAAESDGYTATRHQREVGAGYFDDVARVISGGTLPRSPSKDPPSKPNSESRGKPAGREMTPRETAETLPPTFGCGSVAVPSSKK